MATPRLLKDFPFPVFFPTRRKNEVLKWQTGIFMYQGRSDEKDGNLMEFEAVR